MAELKVLSGSMAGQSLDVGSKDQAVGSSSTAKVRIQDDGVARKHFTIGFSDGWRLKAHADTKVNGAAVSGETALSDGDEIEIGTTKLTFATGATGIAMSDSGEISMDDFSSL